jgi:plastocyanin
MFSPPRGWSFKVTPPRVDQLSMLALVARRGRAFAFARIATLVVVTASFAQGCAGLQHALRLPGFGGVEGDIRLSGHAGATPAPAVVYLVSDGSWDEPGRSREVTVRRRRPRFHPAFVALVQGDLIRFANEEDVHHRLFAVTAAGRIESALAPRSTAPPVPAGMPGLLRFYCSLHPDESYAVFVAPSPYYAVADDDGGYAIRGVPAGAWQLHLWSEAAAGPVRDVDVGFFRSERVTIWLDSEQLR